MKRTTLLLTLCFLSISSIINCQNEIEFRTDGIIVPRTTSASVTSPAMGMLIYDIDIDAFKYYDGTSWQTIGNNQGGEPIDWSGVNNKPPGFADDIDNVNDADSSPTNELQQISKKGNVIGLTNNGGSIIDEVDDADADPVNELQSITLSNQSLGLSNSVETVPLSAISPWTISGNNALKSTGRIGIGYATPNARLDIISEVDEDALRVRVDGNTKLRVRANGGVNVGGNPTAIPENGLYVNGNTGLGRSIPIEKLEINGALRLLGNASSENPAAGTIRWNDNKVDFEGYDGTNWKSLTGLPAPPPPPTYNVGDYEDEGVVFYVSPDGKTIKFVHVAEQGRQDWAVQGTTDVDGAESNFDGLQNTLDIVNDPDITSVSSADICSNLVAGGHSDWYLPAINEVLEMHSVRAIVDATIAAYLGDPLWPGGPIYPQSSTELNAEKYLNVAINGVIGDIDKNADYPIRAIRTLTID